MDKKRSETMSSRRHVVHLRFISMFSQGALATYQVDDQLSRFHEHFCVVCYSDVTRCCIYAGCGGVEPKLIFLG